LHNLLRKQKDSSKKGFDKQFGARPLKKELFRNTLKINLLKRLLLLKFHWRRNFMDIEEGAQELKCKSSQS
jgi:ATP-dependent Clp protease ATP-binding subunit ClpA